ncbi:MAG TPA: SDR family NAD(P)-dependent oxidoreductase [Thermoanaerobaculia bacterium]|nr:SDR family NAD(P)-dependent oxidoreductase [Thermoanaerobaculia bacterium]
MTASESVKTAVVTGASSGFGAAAARALAGVGFRVILGARRLDRLREVAAAIEAAAVPVAPAEPLQPPRAVALPLDVTDLESVAAFVAQVPAAHLLVNNAGGAHGADRIEEAKDEDWRKMWEVNVLGVLRMTRALLPTLVASGDGHVINIGSIAGFETYVGGAGYTGSKHALRALTRTLRLELLGRPVRVTEIAPGLAETEFSLVRLRDPERAKAVYSGMQPLRAEDVADCIVWAATRPAHVNIDEIVVRPRDQATATLVHRRQS